ncbi:MAG: hypothetical protein ACM3UU_00290 [Ignavibacteriales bacterium]
MKTFNFKKFLVLSLTVCMIFSMTSSITFAKDDSGKIDFYKAFSKSEENIDMIGNRIYNWSIYLPSDAVIDKNPKATSFNMSTNSFKGNVNINVYKNIHNLSLEQIYAASLSKDNSDPYYDYYSYDYKCSAKIQTDKHNNRYISISSITPEYSYYGTSGGDEEKGTYSEERTYLGKNNDISYIYKVNISMDLTFYKQHQNLFYKLADSFRTTFDSKNPNIKDLSDLATSYRTFESKIYGWKIELAPYWKLQNQETATTVTFKPLYSSEEIGSQTESSEPAENGENNNVSNSNPSETDTKDSGASGQDQNTASEDQSESGDTDSESAQQPSTETPADQQTSVNDESTANSKVEKINDSLAVSFISSVPQNETFTQWAEKEFKKIRSSYNKSVFSEYSVSQDSIGYNNNKKVMIYKIKNNSRDTFSEGIMLVEGNGYRYKVALRMSDSKFNEGAGKESFYRMLKSFTLTDKKSSFIKEVIPVDSILKADSPKTISLKDFDIKIPADNNWIEPFDIYEGQLEDYSYGYDSEYSSEEDPSLEQLTVNNPSAGVTLAINASIIDQENAAWKDSYTSSQYESTDPTLNRQAYIFTLKDDIVFKSIEKYDIRKMEEASAGDKRKFYNFKTLLNTYTYVIKSGKEEYKLVFTIPVLNTCEENEKLIEDLWKKVVVNKTALGNEIKDWTPIELQKP